MRRLYIVYRVGLELIFAVFTANSYISSVRGR
jgi:hypothetical protein